MIYPGHFWLKSGYVGSKRFPSQAIVLPTKSVHRNL